jgi:hypothetical protein
MRQEGGNQFARYVLACSWRSVSSHGGSLCIPGWPQTSRVREGPLPNAKQLPASDTKKDGSLARFQSAIVPFSGKGVFHSESE